MSPMPGVTRKLPPPPDSEAASGTVFASAVIDLEEERDEAEDEGVEDDRLGQGEAEPLDRGDLVAHLGLAGQRLDDLAEDEADAHAGADGAEAGADAQRDRAQALGGGIARSLGDDVRDESEVHGCSF